MTSRIDISVGDNSSVSQNYGKYQSDPIGFCQETFGETYSADAMTLMRSVRDYPITVAISANGTGKTHSAARIAAWFYKCHPGAQVYTTAAPPAGNLEKLLWGEIGDLIHRYQSTLFQEDKAKHLHIEKGPKEFLTGVTVPVSGTDAQRQAKFSGKHAPYLMFVVDEADAIPDEIYTAIESCMSGGHVRLLCMFNPRAEAGAVYRMIREKRANVVHLSAFSHPNVISGKDQIPGAVTRGVTVRRINEWCRPLMPGETPDNECFEIPDFLVGQVAASQSGGDYPPIQAGQYKIMEPAFSYMVLGQYPAQSTKQLISREWVNRARSRWDAYVSQNGEIPPAGAKAIMGLDVAEYGTDANVSCFRYGGFVERVIFWNGVDLRTTSDRAADEFWRREVSICNVDATGLGAGVAPNMQRDGISANGIKVSEKPTIRTEIGEFGILRDQLWWEVREWLRLDPGAMLPPDEFLIEELLIATYEVDKGKVRIMMKKIMRDLLKRSPDRSDALALTFAPVGFFTDIL